MSIFIFQGQIFGAFVTPPFYAVLRMFLGKNKVMWKKRRCENGVKQGIWKKNRLLKMAHSK